MNQHPHQLRGGVNPPSSSLLTVQAEHLATNRRIRGILERAGSRSPALAKRLAVRIITIDKISREILTGGRSNHAAQQPG